MRASTPFPVALLRALLDRLIPRDDFPGALDAGTDVYFLHQLEGDCASEASALLKGLGQLDQEARARDQTSDFTTLDSLQQDALLRDLEVGRPRTTWPAEIAASAFLARMIELAHEGFYADPGNGGNRDAVSWKMIGYDPQISTDDHREILPQSNDSRSRDGTPTTGSSPPTDR